MAVDATGNERRSGAAASHTRPGEDESERREKAHQSGNESSHPLLGEPLEGTPDSFGRKSRHSKSASVSVDIEPKDEEPTDHVDDDDEEVSIPQEPLKTVLAFFIMFIGFLSTTTALALTHERVPETAPLPDIVLSNVTLEHWGLEATEYIIYVTTTAAVVLAVLHKHRFIVLRRIFLLFGIHYYYRAICMVVTVLPNPNPKSFECAPKLNETSAGIIFERAFKVLFGMGLSVNGQHVYCGDYIYSGHTMTLIMGFLVIKEYTPKRWFLLHLLSFCLTALGVITLLLGHGHYSIDVLIAYWVTTRLWAMYHTLANNPTLADRRNKHNYLASFWWWYIFVYFEAKVEGRPLPKRYSWPLPKKLLQWRPLAWRSRGSAPASDAAAKEDNNQTSHAV